MRKSLQTPCTLKRFDFKVHKIYMPNILSMQGETLPTQFTSKILSPLFPQRIVKRLLTPLCAKTSDQANIGSIDWKRNINCTPLARTHLDTNLSPRNLSDTTKRARLPVDDQVHFKQPKELNVPMVQ